jgi:hypothetical protein
MTVDNKPMDEIYHNGYMYDYIYNLYVYNNFSEEYRLIKENQFGFRQNYSTIDNIFTLFSFFQILKLKIKGNYYSDIQLLYEIHDFILSYILIITLYILPLILFNIIFVEKPFPPYLIKGLFEIYKGTK